MGTIKWIKAEDDLPGYGHMVLVAVNTGVYYVAQLDMDGRWDVGGGYYRDADDITHWAHINAPESEGENG